MSNAPKRSIFTFRCPKCRKKVAISLLKDVVSAHFKEGQGIDYTCKHCSHKFVARCEVRLVATNKGEELN